MKGGLAGRQREDDPRAMRLCSAVGCLDLVAACAGGWIGIASPPVVGGSGDGGGTTALIADKAAPRNTGAAINLVAENSVVLEGRCRSAAILVNATAAAR